MNPNKWLRFYEARRGAEDEEPVCEPSRHRHSGGTNGNVRHSSAKIPAAFKVGGATKPEPGPAHLHPHTQPLALNQDF